MFSSPTEAGGGIVLRARLTTLLLDIFPLVFPLIDVSGAEVELRSVFESCDDCRGEIFRGLSLRGGGENTRLTGERGRDFAGELWCAE